MSVVKPEAIEIPKAAEAKIEDALESEKPSCPLVTKLKSFCDALDQEIEMILSL